MVFPQSPSRSASPPLSRFHGFPTPSRSFPAHTSPSAPFRSWMSLGLDVLVGGVSRASPNLSVTRNASGKPPAGQTLFLGRPEQIKPICIHSAVASLSLSVPVHQVYISSVDPERRRSSNEKQVSSRLPAPFFVFVLCWVVLGRVPGEVRQRRQQN
jgi:hypothetical protein